MNNEFQKIPEEGTPEYEQMMKQYYGEDYELGYRVGFGKRLGAYIVDKILLSIISMIVIFNNSSLMAFFDNNLSNLDFTDEAAINRFAESFEVFMVDLGPIFLFITFLYFATEIFLAQSVGKMLLGIKIGTENRTKADLSQLLIRYFIKQSDVVLGLIAFLVSISLFNTISSIAGFIIFFGCFMVFGRTRQALHDFPAKTAVFAKEAIKEN